MNRKKLLSMLLAAVMVLGMIPMASLAEDTEPACGIETCMCEDCTGVCACTAPVTPACGSDTCECDDCTGECACNAPAHELLGKKLSDVFPDDAFRAYVQTVIGNYDDDEGLSEANINKIETTSSINKGFGYNIYDITGIHFFKGLTSINLSGQRLTSLPKEMAAIMPQITGTLQFSYNSLTQEDWDDVLSKAVNINRATLAVGGNGAISDISNFPEQAGQVAVWGNAITDLSPVGKQALNAGYIPQFQSSYQEVYLDQPITVIEGSAIANVDLSKIEFIDTTGENTQALYVKDGPYTCGASSTDTYRPFANVSDPVLAKKLTSENPENELVDLTDTIEVKVEAGAEYCTFQLAATYNKGIPQGNWVAFADFDVTYHIPINWISYKVTAEDTTLYVGDTKLAQAEAFINNSKVDIQAEGLEYRFYTAEGETNYSVDEFTGLITGLVASEKNTLYVELGRMVNNEFAVLAETTALVNVLSIPVTNYDIDVTVRYVDIDTNAEIGASATRTFTQQDNPEVDYDVTSLTTASFAGYEFVRISGAAAGTSATNVTITVYYRAETTDPGNPTPVQPRQPEVVTPEEEIEIPEALTEYEPTEIVTPVEEEEIEIPEALTDLPPTGGVNHTFWAVWAGILMAAMIAFIHRRKKAQDN